MIAALAVLGAAGVSWPIAAEAVSLAGPDGVVDLSGVWLFREGDNPSFRRPNLDDLSWRELRVPTTGMRAAERWAGHGWYRLHVHLDASAAAEDLMLSLGPAREVVEVYVNGSLVATRGRFWPRPVRAGARLLPLVAVVPHAVLVPGNNVIAVRVYDPSGHGGLVAGPLRLGAPNHIQPLATRLTQRVLGVRVGLALLALLVSVGYFATQTDRRTVASAWWIFGAGVLLCFAHLAGAGALEPWIWIDLTPRLPLVLALGAILCLGSALAAQYEDLEPQQLRVAQGVGLGLVWLLSLMPASWFLVVGGPVVLLCALVAILYAANLCARAVRRGEPGSLPTFLALCAEAAAVVYDGFSAEPGDLLPPVSVMGAALLLALLALVQARQIVSERARALQRMVRLDQRLDGMLHRSLLEAATLPRTDGLAFLSTAIHEIARDLQVRRCSLVLRHTDGSLRIRASVGLPRHLSSSVIDPDSITAFAFMNDRTITQDRLPDELREARRGRYQTEIFVTHPVRHEGRVLGVLNLSDRNDGGTFADAEQQAIAEVADRLGMAIALLPASTLEPPPEAPANSQVRPQTVRAEDVEAAFDLVALREEPEPDPQPPEASAQEAGPSEDANVTEEPADEAATTVADPEPGAG